SASVAHVASQAVGLAVEGGLCPQPAAGTTTGGGGLRKLDLTHGRATESALPDCRPVAAARLVGPAGIVAGGDGVAAGPARLAPAPAALSAALCCWPVLGLFPSSPATGRAAAGRTGWQPYGSDRAHSRIATAYRHRLALRDRAGA